MNYPTECLRAQWNEACLQLGVPALTLETSAKIMAVLLHFGNNEAFDHSPHFMADCHYVQRRYNLGGGLTPDADFVEAFQRWEKGMEGADEPPKWAKDLFKRMYNIDV